MMKRLLYLFMLLALTGCYYDKEEELYPNSFYNDTTTYYYAKDIKPLMDASCATSLCHSTGKQAPDLSTYAGLSASAARVKVRAVDQRNMPTGGSLSVADINKLRNWIAAGALNN